MKKTNIKLRTLLIVLSLMAVLSPAVGGYLYYSSLRESSLASEHNEAEEHLKDLGNDVDSYLEWLLITIKFLAGLKELEQSLLSGDVVALAETNAIFDHFRDAMGASVCYLMDRSGNTIASSNRDAADSFVGKNYGFRPYFKQAMQGKPTVYMALGVTSKKRGVYYSHPVYGKGKERPLGVAVIKISVDLIEKHLMKPHDGIVLLTDPHGVVFVSSRGDWLYHVLWKASSETISDITKTKQFGTGPWNWTGVKLVGEDIAVDNRGNEYHVHRRETVNYPGWHLIYLHSHFEVTEKIIAPLRKSVGVGVVVLCVFFGLIVFVFFLKANTSIIQRGKAEEKLRESEAFTKSVMDNLPIGIAVNSVDPAVEFDYMNDNFPKFYRTTREALADPDAFWDAVYEDPEFREEMKKRVLDDCASGDPERMHWGDVPITRKGDKTAFITARNIPVPDKQLAISTVWDVTGRKQAEEALRESENRYRSLIDFNPDGIYVSREGRIIYVNQATVDIWGAKNKDELIGKTVFELIHPDYREIAKQRYRLMMEQGVSVPLINFIFLRLDKGETLVQAIAAPVNFRGETAVLTAVRDITEQRKAEAEKTRLESQLQQAQKMESIGTLAGGIAHDFNNILSPIMIHSEMAMMDLPPESPLQPNLQQIFKAGERARDMVKQILAFSRKEQQERTPIRLGAILKEVVKLLRSSIPTTIEIHHNIETEIDIVFANHTQMHQVILNLCSNASHAMREKGGVLEIGLSDLYLHSEAAGEFENLNPGSYLRLTVKDTGHGIDPEIINRIFDPYFTTKGIGEGTGMGLSAAHGIVKSHGGDITVESEAGKSTTFHVLLPKFKEGIPIVTEPKIQLPKGTERILFVDDEKGAVDAIQQMLENLGYKVTARTSSIEALEAFRNKSDSFDLVITDMTMPNMTGKDLAKELMSIRSDIPIILCTGFSEQIDEKRAKEMGIRAFIMKPVVMRDIANTIRQVLGD